MSGLSSAGAGPDLVVGSEATADLVRARAGDSDAFARLVGPLRPELHAHCYRMLGSAHDADDALQDALLRAWRGLAGFEGRSSLRSWLYTVTTRACLDAVAARGRRALPVDLGPASDQVVVDDRPVTEVAWLGPYPELSGAGSAGPTGRYEQREAVELAFVAALQHLPGNQRAALLLVEVLGFTPAEIATMLQTSTASVNSALQRARQVVAEKVPSPTQQRSLRALGDARLREVVTAFTTALEQGDAAGLVSLLAEDVTWSMPPLPHWYQGMAAVVEFARAVPMSRCGSWRHLPTWANGQPAVGGYRRIDPDGDYHAWSVNILRFRSDRIAEITSFIGADHFTLLSLPTALPAGQRVEVELTGLG